jgi:hypothetical protein
MADSFALARFKGRLARESVAAKPTWSPEQRAEILMRTQTMEEIREAAGVLGLSFNEAYRERAQAYEERWPTWW